MGIGILGGSFDPIHNAHVKIALLVKRKLKLSKVLFVPAYKSPLKITQVADSIHRMNMIRLAIKGERCLQLCDLELRRKGTSYTIDTVKKLLKRAKKSRFFLIIGTDMLKELPKWRQINELKKLVTFVIVSRSGSEELKMTLDGADYIRLKNRPLKLSSTIIRQRIASGKPIKNLVDKKVYKCIIENRLYR